MTSKEANKFVYDYFSSLHSTDDKLNRKLLKLAELRQLSKSFGSIQTDSDRVQTSNTGDRLSKIIAMIVDLEREILNIENDYTYRREECAGEIAKLTNANEKSVMYDRYVKRRSLRDISKATGKKYATVKTIHRRAKLHFAENAKKIVD